METSMELLNRAKRVCRVNKVNPNVFIQRERLGLIIYQFKRFFGRRRYIVNSMQPLKHTRHRKHCIIWSRFRQIGDRIDAGLSQKIVRLPPAKMYRLKYDEQYGTLKVVERKPVCVRRKKRKPKKTKKNKLSKSKVVDKPKSDTFVRLDSGSSSRVTPITNHCSNGEVPSMSEDCVTTSREIESYIQPAESSPKRITEHRSSTPVQDELDMQTTNQMINDGLIVQSSELHVSENRVISVLDGGLDDSPPIDGSSRPNSGETAENRVEPAVSNESTPSKTETELNDQLRQQLSFLKMGKRKESFLGEPISRTIRPGSTTNSRHSSSSSSRSSSNASIEDRSLNHIPANIQADPSKPRRTFIDSLIKRINSNTGSECNNRIITPKRLVVKPNKPWDEDNSNPSDTPDFLGFNDESSDRFATPTVPGLLATPVVQTPNAQAAFVSEALDHFMKENALENSAPVELPIARVRDDALVYDGAVPPTMCCPQLPQSHQKPRTLAAKREQLEGETNVKILMIENESSVFRELRKRSRAGAVANYRHARLIQEHKIPFTRDCWRATSWLATEMGRFYYQTLNTGDGRQLNIFSGNGNFLNKTIYTIPKLPKLRSICTTRCRSLVGININYMKDHMKLITARSRNDHNTPKSVIETKFETIPMPKMLNTLCLQRRTLTTGPLSKKLLSDQRSSLDMDLGPLQVYNMPRIHLEVWPKRETALPEQIRPFLKMALPFDCLTPKWVDFALTALKVPLKESYTTLSGRSISKTIYTEDKRPPKPATIQASPNVSYVFDIPYTNNQSRLLIRTRTHASSKSKTTTMQSAVPSECELYSDPVNSIMSFDRGIDLDDELAVDVAAVLRGMIDSVVVSVNEKSMWKEDPDDRRICLDVPMNRATASCSVPAGLSIRKNSDNSQRIRKELKRLNATIIDNYEAPAKVNCTEDFCKMGCVCNSLTRSRICPTHCNKFDCMIKCSCPQKSGLSTTRNSNIEQMRSRATADLAKEEKEFRATVVLSQDHTIYIPNKENVGKRSKRVPKRFHDSVETPFNQDAAMPATVQAPVAAKPQHSPKKSYGIVAIQNELRKIAHCSVSLLQLPALDKLQPWCMVHCLYKCFCKQRAITGKPFEFDDATNHPTIDDEEYLPSKKRQYTFEKPQAVNVENRLPSGSPTFTDRVMGEHQAARTAPFSGTKRNRREIRKMHEHYRQEERHNPLLKKLLNNRKYRCLNNNDGKLYTIESDSGPSNDLTEIENNTVNLNKSSSSSAITSQSLLKPIEERSPPNARKIAVASGSVTQPQSLSNASSSTRSQAISTKKRDFRHAHNVKHFNYCVNHTMDYIKTSQINTTMVKPPVPKELMCIQWNRFVDHVINDRIFVWLIKLDKTNEPVLGVTVEKVMPLVPEAISAINIKSVPSDELPLIAKLFKHAVSGPKTAQAAILLNGVTNYWKIISIIHSDKNYMEEEHKIQPSPQTHPLVAVKISKLFAALTTTSKTNPISFRTPLMGMSGPPSARLDAKIELPNGDMVLTANRVTYTRMPFCPFYEGDHKFFVLSVANDFTHVFLSAWNSFILKDKIDNALKMSQQYKKIVKISAPNIIPDVFATCDAPMQIFFGPYDINAKLDIGLYHWHSNKLMPIQLYAKLIHSMNGMTGQPRTTGRWIHVVDRSTKKPNTPAQRAQLTPPLGNVACKRNDTEDCENELNDEDDCMIVETSVNDIIELIDDSDDEPDTNMKREEYISLSPPTDFPPLDLPLTSEGASTSQSNNNSSSHASIGVAECTPSSPSIDLPSTSDSASTSQSNNNRSSPPHVCTESVESNNSQGSDVAEATPSTPSIDLPFTSDGASTSQSNNNISSPPHFSIESVESNHSQGSAVAEAQATPSTPSIDSPFTSDGASTSQSNNNIPSPPHVSVESVESNNSQELDVAEATPSSPKSSDKCADVQLIPRNPPSRFSIMASMKPRSPKANTSPSPVPTNTEDTTMISLTSIPSTSTTIEAETPVLPKVPKEITCHIVPKQNPATLAPGTFITLSKASIRNLPKNLIITKIPGKRKSLEPDLPTQPPTKQVRIDTESGTSAASNIPIRSAEVINLESDDEDLDAPFASQLNSVRVISIPSTTSVSIIPIPNDPKSIPASGKGFLVSNFGKRMGKIEVEVKDGYITMCLFNVRQPPMEFNHAEINTRLTEIIRNKVYAFEPRTLRINWHFVPENKLTTIAEYPSWTNQPDPLFTSTTVVTETISIDLLSDFESNTSLPRELLLRLLVLKLAYLCKWDNHALRSKSFSDILRRGTSYVKNEIDREAKYEGLKVSWAIKIHCNKMKLQELQRKHGVIANNSSAAAAAAASSSSVTKNKSLVKHSDVIEIDDDDDE